MRIALFSDIHANLPALEAVFSDLDNQDIDACYCLGDLVGYAPWPNEVIQAIRKRKIPTIAGNYDDGVGKGSDDCGCAYKTPEDQSRGVESITYTNNFVNPKERLFLKSLPSHLVIKYNSNEGPIHILLVHGSPRKINEYLTEDRPDQSLIRMMEEYNCHILAFGHTHKPYHKILQTEDGKYLHAINIGSVGKPKDGDVRACYTIIEFNSDISLKLKDSINIEFRRINYDFEKVAKAIEESPLPDEFADMIRKAY